MGVQPTLSPFPKSAPTEKLDEKQISHIEIASSPSSEDNKSWDVDLEKGDLPLPPANLPEYRPCEDLNEIKEVLEEGVWLLGGLTSILLQVAHPQVGAGVAEHSDFVHRALNRADNTAIYIFTMAFGKEHEKRAVKTYVDRMHKRIQGSTAAAGKYDAMNVESQLWVAATVYTAAVSMYEMVYGPMSAWKAERVYRQFSYIGTSLQMPPEMWPKDVPAFNAYYQDMIDNHLRATPEGQEVFKNLMHPSKSVPIWLRPIVIFAMPFAKAFTIETLPPKIRADFGLKSGKKSRFMTGATIAVIKATYPHLPRKMRSFPKSYYLWMMRRQLKKRGMTSSRDGYAK